MSKDAEYKSVSEYVWDTYMDDEAFAVGVGCCMYMYVHM